MARQARFTNYFNPEVEMADSYSAKWKSGFRGSSIMPADKAFDELEKIRKKNDGELHATDVVEAARSNRHKLHKLFEWDDSVAAEKHRESQARVVIRSIVIERPELQNEETRTYELQKSKTTPRAQSYTTTEELMKDPEARAELLQRALGELLAIRRRYHGLQELSIVFRDVDKLLETVKV